MHLNSEYIMYYIHELRKGRGFPKKPRFFGTHPYVAYVLTIQMQNKWNLLMNLIKKEKNIENCDL